MSSRAIHKDHAQNSSWGSLGFLWEGYGYLLGGSWASLGRSWALLGAFWVPLGVFWAPLGASWVPLGCLLGGLGAHLGGLEAVLERHAKIIQKSMPKMTDFGSQKGAQREPKSNPKPTKTEDKNRCEKQTSSRSSWSRLGAILGYLD